MSEVPCEWICNYFQFLLLRSSDCCIPTSGFIGYWNERRQMLRCSRWKRSKASEIRQKKADTIPYLDGVSSQERAIPGSHRAIWCCHLCVCVCVFHHKCEICHTYPNFRPIWDVSRGMFELTDPPIHEFFCYKPGTQFYFPDSLFISFFLVCLFFALLLKRRTTMYGNIAWYL